MNMYRDWAEAVYRDAVEAEAYERRLREHHMDLGVCHFHPWVRVSTGGGTPAFDGLCGECEGAMAEDFEAVSRKA